MFHSLLHKVGLTLYQGLSCALLKDTVTSSLSRKILHKDLQIILAYWDNSLQLLFSPLDNISQPKFTCVSPLGYCYFFFKRNKRLLLFATEMDSCARFLVSIPLDQFRFLQPFWSTIRYRFYYYIRSFIRTLQVSSTATVIAYQLARAPFLPLSNCYIAAGFSFMMRIVLLLITVIMCCGPPFCTHIFLSAKRFYFSTRSAPVAKYCFTLRG